MWVVSSEDEFCTHHVSQSHSTAVVVTDCMDSTDTYNGIIFVMYSKKNLLEHVYQVGPSIDELPHKGCHVDKCLDHLSGILRASFEVRFLRYGT